MSTEKWKQENADRMRKYRREYYHRNKEKSVNRILERKKATQQWLRSLKIGNKCLYCSETYPACLDYHHRDQEQKLFNISKAATNGYSREKILAEIVKCDLICANCHRKIHDDSW